MSVLIIPRQCVIVKRTLSVYLAGDPRREECRKDSVLRLENNLLETS